MTTPAVDGTDCALCGEYIDLPADRSVTEAVIDHFADEHGLLE